MEAYKTMRIEYNKLFAKIKENRLTQKEFREQSGINGATMQKMLHGESITTNTICRICDYFQCMPDEIMEFIPETNYPEDIKAKQKAKADLQQQIADLQAKLKQI